jgi:hypothetical protein
VKADFTNSNYLCSTALFFQIQKDSAMTRKESGRYSIFDEKTDDKPRINIQSASTSRRSDGAEDPHTGGGRSFGNAFRETRSVDVKQKNYFEILGVDHDSSGSLLSIFISSKSYSPIFCD